MSAQPATLTPLSARRRRTDKVARALLLGATLVALVPLVLIVYYLIKKGIGSWSLDFFTTDPSGRFFGDPGGIRSAIVGTTLIVGLATVIAVPIGIGVALYLVEYGSESRFANVVRYFVDVMTGVPSIVFGLFIYIVLVLGGVAGGFAGWKGSIALALLMLPVVTRASEVVLKLVPDSLREAALALGAPRWRVVWRVVLPTALISLVTGSLLAIARPPGADLRALWRYAATIAVVAALSLILTQSDRVVLARLVTTARLGEYAAAYNLLFGLSLIQLFVGSAVYPSFAADFAAVNIGRIRDRHHDAAQLILYLYALPFSVLVVFGEPVLAVLLPPDAARSTAVVLALLAVGFLFNALAAVPYSLSIAGGLSRLPILVNAVSLAWYLPALILGVVAYGPAGAAAAWAVLNVSYVFTLIPVAQRRLLGGGTLRWLRSAFLPFPVVGLVTFGIARSIVGLRGPQDPALWLAIVASAVLYAVVGFRLLSPSVRAHARQLVTDSLWARSTPLS